MRWKLVFVVQKKEKKEKKKSGGDWEEFSLPAEDL